MSLFGATIYDSIIHFVLFIAATSYSVHKEYLIVQLEEKFNIVMNSTTQS